MKITKIKPQKRSKKRCSIYIDGEFRFGLDLTTVTKHGLRDGDEITDETINVLLHQEELSKIRERAFTILRYRERSMQELKRRLLTAGYDETLVDAIIQEFQNDNTINDERFAKAFINDYTTLKPRGNRFISRELRRKGIPQEIINTLIESRDELSLVKTYFEKKLSNLDLHDYKDRQKVIRRLLSRGFTPDSIYKAIDEDT